MAGFGPGTGIGAMRRTAGEPERVVKRPGRGHRDEEQRLLAGPGVRVLAAAEGIRAFGQDGSAQAAEGDEVLGDAGVARIAGLEQGTTQQKGGDDGVQQPRQDGGEAAQGGADRVLTGVAGGVHGGGFLLGEEGSAK